MPKTVDQLMLNVITELLLFAITTIIWGNILQDLASFKTKAFKKFSNWVISLMFYFLTEAIIYPVSFYFHNSVFDFAISGIETVLAYIIAISLCDWYFEFLKEEKDLKKSFIRISYLLIPILFFPALLISHLVHNYDYLMLPLIVFLAYIIVLLAINRKVIGTKNTVIVFAFIGLFYLAYIQPFWAYLPADITTALFTIVIYLRVWQRRKTEMIESEKKLALQEVELTNARVNIMLSQIGPHFLYNTLNSISALCDEDPKLAQTVTDNFAQYLRGNLQSINSDALISFTKELEHTKVYTDIEQIRFGESLHIVYDTEEINFFLPSLTLQPLVENAIKHGVRKKSEPGTVTVRTAKNGDCYTITVSDDGVGFDLQSVKKDGQNHFGLDLIEKRLKQFCDGKLDIESTIGVGTKITVTIPDLYLTGR